MSQSFAQDIERAAGNEPILSIVVAKFERRYSAEPCPRDVGGIFDKPVAWAEVRAFLDYPYDTGFGGADCHAIYAWTPTRVLFVHEYDGSTGFVSVPRNPTACTPVMGGE